MNTFTHREQQRILVFMGKDNPAEALATAPTLPWVWLHVKDYWQQGDGL